jgi:aminobenzoyl-glutamate transport protein
VISLLALWSALPIGLFPGSGFMRDPATNDLLRSPFLSSVVAIIFVYGLVCGIAYGIGARTIRSDEDVIKGMGQSMSTLGLYLVLIFFAAQFVAFFNWTQLGLVFAVEGAGVLDAARGWVLDDSTDPSGWRWVAAKVLIMAGFIALTAVANLFMGSASAKWALMAPIFVPMFMLLGYSPELTQVAYRIGDSVTNIISPMMSYFALIIAFLQRYEPKAGIGTVISVMLPYSVVFAIGWTLLFAIWLSLGLPIGPGAPLEYVPAA